MKTRNTCLIIVILCVLLGTQVPLRAEDNTVPASADIVSQAWEFSIQNNKEKLDAAIKQLVDGYSVKAKEQASQLSNFPAFDQRDKYKIMNDVATGYFIQAEYLMREGKKEEAIAAFKKLIEDYPWAQAWDPSRGSFWSIKEKSEVSLCVMEGKEDCSPKQQAKPEAPRTVPTLAFPGSNTVVDYASYGEFTNVGTKEYIYRILNKEGLAQAVGEGIYPNLTDIYKDPAYKKLLQAGRLEGSHWDFVNTTDLEAAFYKWATASESWGVKLFYLANTLEKAKMYNQAIKAYYALVVHFPSTIAMTYWQTPWYPAQAAIAKIKHIIRTHPELNIEFKGARVSVANAFDNEGANDITTSNPGTLKNVTDLDKAANESTLDRASINLGQPIKYLGEGKIRFAKYANGHWQLLVEGKPYLIKGVTYAPTKVGQSPDKGTLANWMQADANGNGLIDGAYDAFIDKNLNNVQDDDELNKGDFAIMKEMGVNTLRIYHHPNAPDKALLKRMYQDYGIRVIMGDYLGKYAIGSGATWLEGTDYEKPEHQAKMMESVRSMVMEFKDEPYILMWVLGNENNYGVASNADKKPAAYYKFLNDVAKMIKSIDPNHPVSVCNGDTLFLDLFAQNAPDVDAFGANVYRGDYGFGSFWQQVSEVADKPAFITEYGAPAYGEHMTYHEAQDAQATYHRGNWLDIYYNSAGFPDGIGNAVGGIAFSWVDEWWKNYEPALHDTKADVQGPFPGGYYFEEWFGLFGQGNGKNSPYLREPRKVYYTYKELWKKD